MTKPFEIRFSATGSSVFATVPTLTPNIENLKFCKLTDSPMSAELLARFLNDRMSTELFAMRRNAYLDGYNDHRLGRAARLLFYNGWEG